MNINVSCSVSLPPFFDVKFTGKKCPKVYREKIMWPEANPQDVITADCPDGMRSGNSLL